MNQTAPNAEAGGMGKPHVPVTGEAGQPAMRPRDARQTRMGQTLAQTVAVLMRDPHYRNMRLADLEWLVLPPLMAGQFRLAHAPTPSLEKAGAGAKPQKGGMMVPVAVALWARVSPQLDKTLSDDADGRVRLKINEWASGDHIWMMAVAGDPSAVPLLLKQLGENDFEEQRVKVRVRGADGKSMVKTLGQHS